MSTLQKMINHFEGNLYKLQLFEYFLAFLHTMCLGHIEAFFFFIARGQDEHYLLLLFPVKGWVPLDGLGTRGLSASFLSGLR